MDRKLKVRGKSKVAFNVDKENPPEKIIELIEEKENEIYCVKLLEEDESTEDGSQKLERKLRKKKTKSIKRPVSINIELIIPNDKD